MVARDVQRELEKYANDKRKNSNEWFFKTGKGEYGEGDRFIGVSMPDIRKAIKGFSTLSFTEISKLLNSPIHEVRMSGVLILTGNAKKAFKKNDIDEHKKISDFYLENRQGINNWDLVDVSCHYIIGNAIINKIYDLQLLDELASSDILWDRRIAMVTTYAFIRNGDVFPTVILAKKLLDNKEDLMHKAVGWMLREAWKREPGIIENFLLENYNDIPRTALRYAIERMEETKRKEFLYWNKKG
ncbi:MAG TPA: DNA alkylation repair protein [Bacteroidetes bacterium]|nr:DNA alkylation repair protein [Bacteroidota bacterium]